MESVNFTFGDYNACTEQEIVSITPEGISLKTFGFISFQECACNYQQAEGGSGHCVGERGILSFTFYTSPKPVMIKFIPKNRFLELIAKENTLTRFHNLQKQLLYYGYTTRDIS